MAKGKRPGIIEFGNTKEAFYASLAPLIAFPLVGSGTTALHGDWQLAIVSFLSRLCAVLVLPLVTFEVARILGREKLWLRAATALNWSFWIMLPVFIIAALLFSIMAQAGMTQVAAFGVSFSLAGLYLLWNRWFILRTGLGLGIWQAVLVVVIVSIGAGACTFLPLAFGFWPDTSQIPSL
ncbi:MAG: hypothetical protein PHU07_05970 [Acidocella sp.]|nr:hypothetical protein [Acidocella sp.]